MRNTFILLLRLSLGVAFLSAVADRFGFWGPEGTALVTWGNWDNFLSYTGSLTFGASGILLKSLAIFATLLEILFGIFLILGYKTKQTAFCSGILLLLFALGMVFNTNIKYALDYSVFSACFGAFLLAYEPVVKLSIDKLLKG